MFSISCVLGNRDHVGSAELISLLILEHTFLFPNQIISAEIWSVAQLYVFIANNFINYSGAISKYCGNGQALYPYHW